MEQNKKENLFGKQNYILLIAGAVFIVMGYILMGGKGSTLVAYEPDIFSHLRIHVAPLVCLVGYLLNIVGICLNRAERP